MADGYGVGLFDSSGPQKFADAVTKITGALTGVQSAFTTFGTSAQKSIAGISKAIDEMMAKFASAQRTAAGMGGRAPGAAPAGGPTTTNAAGWTPQPPKPQWQQPPLFTTEAHPGGGEFRPMEPNTADTVQHPSMTTEGGGGGGGMGIVSGMGMGGIGGMGGRAATSMIPAAAGAAAGWMGGAGGQQLMQNAIQGASIGQMIAPAFGQSARSMYVIPRGQLVQNAGDYAQGNYYAAMMMGAGPGSRNLGAFQRGANQIMTLLPGTSYQGAMQIQNQMQQAGTLNAAAAVGLNLRPGGQAQTAEQNFQAIFNRMFIGGVPDAKTLEAVMGPGGNGQANLASIGIQPGSDTYYAFMQYAITRVNQNRQGRQMPDVGTAAGAKKAGLDTPYYAQLQAQSAKSQLQSRAEPTMADASKVMNEAATKFYDAVNNLTGGGIKGGLTGLLGHIPGVGSFLNKAPGVSNLLGGGGISGMLMGGMGPGAQIGKSILGKILHFQEGGPVPGHGPTMAVVHGGEHILSQEQVAKIAGSQKDRHQTGHDPDSAIGKLLSKLTDASLENTAIKLLLSPVPQGTLLAAAASGAPAGVSSQTGGKAVGGQAGPGGSVAGAPPAAAASPAGQGAKMPSPYTWKASSGHLNFQDLMSLYTSKLSTAAGSQGGGGGGGGGGGAPSTAVGPLSGGSNAQQAYNFLMAHGLKDFQAAGVVGNLAQESTVNPNLTGASGLGIAQWIGGRRTALENLAKKQNKPATDLGVQLAYLWSELTGAESGALSALKQSQDVSQATAAFEQQFERAGIPAMANRIAYAQKVLASKGASFQKGTAYVNQTQIALLHRGEAVIPASANPVSNYAGTGGPPITVNLQFGTGSVVLQVPPTATQQDMESMAKKFVAAIAKPQLLEAVRNS